MKDGEYVLKYFELASKNTRKGRRHFKLVLAEIFPDTSVSEVEEVGTKYNDNGLTWLRGPVSRHVDTIIGMSLRVEFANEERTQIIGHGCTGTDDGLPVFEDAVQIGTFTKGYLEDVTTDGGMNTYLIGEGYIDALCYKNFVNRLDEDLAAGDTISGSVEIMAADDQDQIIYRYGYKEYGRIPEDFQFSGYALLGIRPADPAAKLLELNNKEGKTMDKDELKALVSEVVSEYSNQINEINSAKASYEEELKKVTAEKNELTDEISKVKEALAQNEKELAKKDEEANELWQERAALLKEIGELKAAARLAELDKALAGFDETEKEYAATEIEAFNADPMSVEINSIVEKVLIGIGKAAKESAKVPAEQNSSKNQSISDVDIYGEVIQSNNSDDSIY